MPMRLVLLLIALVVAAGQPSLRDLRFGAVEPYDAPQAAAQLGLGWGRVRFHWGWTQPNGPDDWVETEFTARDLAGELAAGRQVVGILIGIPDWARDPKTDLPKGLYLPHDDPANTWAGFVRTAASRFAGKIDHWVIWNEPDVWDEDHPAHTWSGTVEDFAQLERVAYLAAHAANPNAVVHLAAMAHWWDADYGRELYFRRLLAALAAAPDAAAHRYYFDAASVHVYFNPAQVYDLIRLYRAMLDDFGMDQPIWVLETNAPPSEDPTWPVAEPSRKVSLREQAAFIPQALALAMAAGAERVCIYKLVDIETDKAANPEPFGLVRMDGSARPAFETTQVALALMRGATGFRWVDRHTIGRVVWQQGERRVTMLWSRLPAWLTAQFPAQTGRATLIDAFGRERPISAREGYYRIDLPAAECQETVEDYCMIGGLPMYLVEETRVSAVGRLQGEGAPPSPTPGWPWQAQD